MAGDGAGFEAWRRAERQRLIAERERMDPRELAAARERFAGVIPRAFPLLARCTVAFCWPYRAEPDVRFAIRALREAGAVAALPVVVARAQPLQFRRWWPGAPMKAGALGIPYPDATERVTPDAAFVPMVGYNPRGYRLGYGGGFFDRTLAAASPRPIAVGVVMERFRVDAFEPEPHDLPMDFVLTERAVYAAGGEPLRELAEDECAAAFARLAAQRGLPRSIGDPPAGALASPVCYASQFPGWFGESPEARRDTEDG